MLKRCLYICCILLVGAFSSGAQNSKLLHQLKISSNGRFFTDENGKPFFWLGDTGWLLFGKLTREEANQYLEDRKQKGFNVIQVMVVHSMEVVNAYGDSALTRKNVSTPNISVGSTLANPAEYDYWDHVDYIIRLAAEKGLYMALVPIWGTNLKAGMVTLTQAAAYAKFLADRYVNDWNIIWLNGGDIRGSDSTETWRVIGTTIKSIDKNHLMTFHPFGRTTSSTWFHNEPWLDFNMFQSGHRSYQQDTASSEHRFGPDNYRFVDLDYKKVPIKPTLDGEPSYEHIPYGLHDTTQPRWNDNDTRRYAYWEIFAGGAGYTFGHSSVMQMHKPADMKPAYGSKKYWNDAINDPGATQMKYLKMLMLSNPYFDRLPDQSLVNNENASRYDYIVATKGEGYAMMYTFNGRNFTVNTNKLHFKNIKGYWYNPRNGASQPVSVPLNESSVEFNPPGEKMDGNDWVLVLQKA